MDGGIWISLDTVIKLILFLLFCANINFDSIIHDNYLLCFLINSLDYCYYATTKIIHDERN